MTTPSKTAINIGTLIESRPGVCGGSPVLKGTRMPVKAIAARHKMGWTPETVIEQFPHLDVAAVYAAFAYYFANKAEVEADLELDRIAEAEGAAEERARRSAAIDR
ncbi:MAG TPA: DUF433 domain-containing protein [Tepidiformaceae bacterium]|nr:DUF433 domain-containing protein [Tepidiformaceae bacterium]HMO95731.1 DUF433 domain-containing protein [Tepidiformaceae bacterium]